MGQEELLRAIEEEALAQRERILREADEQAGAIVAEAERRSEEHARKRREMEAARLGRLRARAVNRARIRASAMVLGAKQEIIDQVLSRARDVIEGSDKETTTRLVSALYDEVKAEWPEDLSTPFVRMNPAYAWLVQDRATEIEPDESLDMGVVFVSRDRRLMIENTIRTRMEKGKRHILTLLGRLLFR
ncbi:MAG TPA: hypothetical protein ENJ37_02795 [Deltaproteobacteria bacterium]|nr:hypothetical protein [Deltaproteobacteria bacterium]